MCSSSRACANAILAFLLAVLVASLSSAQEESKSMSSQRPSSRGSESLLALHRPVPQFERRLKDAGVETAPHSHSGLIWLLPAEAARTLRSLYPTEVRYLAPALQLQVEVASPDANLTDSVETLGGLVLESHGRFCVVAVPLPKLPEVRKLPGVVRVSKSLPLYPSQR